MSARRHRHRHRHTDRQTRKREWAGRRAARASPPTGGKRGAPHRDKICTSNARSAPGTSDKVGARAGGPRAQRAGAGLPERSQNGEACGGSHDEARKLASQSLNSFTRSITHHQPVSALLVARAWSITSPTTQPTHPYLTPCRDWEALPCMAEFAALIPTVGMIRALRLES